VEFKPVGGAAPELMLLDENDKIVERIRLDKYNRKRCNELLLEKGFYKKSNKDEEVPEEYKNGPFIPKTTPKEEL